MVVEVGGAAKSIKGISVEESDEASAEFGDTGKTKKCIKVLASSVKRQKGTVKTDSGSSKAEKEGKSIVLASPERLKGTEEVMGSTPIPDVVSDSGVKRSEGDEEVPGSMPVPDAVCEITGTKVWITRVYRRPITLPLDNWSQSSGVSSGNARRAFIEHFSRKL
jgi:ubiquitin-like-specific protease 1C/D